MQTYQMIQIIITPEKYHDLKVYALTHKLRVSRIVGDLICKFLEENEKDDTK